MRERLDAGLGDVWMNVQVQSRIKLAIWFIPESPANGQVVNQRILLFIWVIEIGRQVVSGIEERMRRARLVSAMEKVMFQGTDARAVEHWLLFQVPS